MSIVSSKKKKNESCVYNCLSLSFSRWDTHAHRLADFNYADPHLEIYPGQDYSDARLRDFEKGAYNSAYIDIHTDSLL